MPYALERFGNQAIVINTKTGKHFSTNPIPLASAKRQIRLLQRKEHEKAPKRIAPVVETPTTQG